MAEIAEKTRKVGLAGRSRSPGRAKALVTPARLREVLMDDLGEVIIRATAKAGQRVSESVLDVFGVTSFGSLPFTELATELINKQQPDPLIYQTFMMTMKLELDTWGMSNRAKEGVELAISAYLYREFPHAADFFLSEYPLLAKKFPVGANKKRDYHVKLMDDEAAEFQAAAADAFKRGLSVAELKEAIEEKLAAKAARGTTARATALPRPEAAGEVTDRATAEASPSKGLTIFGNIPPEFRTRGYLRNGELPAEFSDPEVVATAREIDHANRRTKIETLEPEVADQVRLARRIVKYDRDRRQKGAPSPS